MLNKIVYYFLQKHCVFKYATSNVWNALKQLIQNKVDKPRIDKR